MECVFLEYHKTPKGTEYKDFLMFARNVARVFGRCDCDTRLVDRPAICGFSVCCPKCCWEARHDSVDEEVLKLETLLKDYFQMPKKR